MNDSLITDKQKIRSKCLFYRDYLTNLERMEKSKRIHENLKNIQEFQEAEMVLVYMDYRSEVITTPFVEELLNTTDKRTFAPRVEGMDISFYEIKSLEELESGYQNIREPQIEEERLLTPQMLENKNVFLMVPGVAFDRNMGRMGYGKGFYDRFLHKYKDADIVKAGIAYECQFAKEIPVEDHDIRMDIIITEKQILWKNIL